MGLPLPVISNQKFNKYVKELCKLVGIDDPIEIIRYKGAIKQSTIYKKHEIISAHTGRKPLQLFLWKRNPSRNRDEDNRTFRLQKLSTLCESNGRKKRNEMQKAWGAPI